MNSLNMLGAVIGFILYLTFAWLIRYRNLELNMATFLLWAILDTIASVSTYHKSGNWLLPAVYAVGGLCICRELIIKRLVKWTNFETAISVLVIICLLAWSISGPRMAIIISTASVVLSGLPQCRDAFLSPATQPFVLYSMFFVANGLTLAGGRHWSVEERLYSAGCLVITVLVVIPLVNYRIRHRIPLRDWI